MAASTTPQAAPSTLIQAILEVCKTFPTWDIMKQVFPDFTKKYELINGVSDISSLTRIGINSKNDTTNTTDGVDVNDYFITLRDFCRIVNTVLLVDQNNKTLVQINTDTRPANDPNSKIPTSKYRTFDYHTSADPGVCILPNTNGWPITEFAKTEMNNSSIGELNEILNIHVNFDLLESVLKNLVTSSKEQRTVYNLFDPIFEAMNDAMGGINQLSFHYVEPARTFYIVDRSVQVDKKDEIPVLDVTGLKTSVTQFDFTTKLSPAISTMIAVSAQAAGQDVGLEAEALFKWNEGLTDRITAERKQTIRSTGTTASEKEAIHQENLKLQQGRINNITGVLNTYWDKKIYKSDDLKNAVVQYQAYAAYFIQSFKEKGDTTGPAGIIPFEVNIQMDGISGMKIGQAFQINEGIMPNKYHGTVGFIVTGVEHSISNNRWSTKLKAQTIILEGADKRQAPDQKADPITGESTNEVKEIKPVSVSNTIKEEYIPALDKAVPTGSKGIKMLMIAQAQMEGFSPKTLSYRSNNPGNIGNTDNSKKRTYYATLEEGVKVQYSYVENVALNKKYLYRKVKSPYILNTRIERPAIYDKDSKQSYPGVDFIYTGTLDQYLKIYSTGARKYNTYVNLVIGYFKKQGYTITKDTTLQEIYNIK